MASKTSSLTKNQTKAVGYLRVSTTDQDLDKNKSDILMLANQKRLSHVEFVEEKASCKISWRKRAIATIIDDLGDGDCLIVSELSRLGRSMLECLEILSVAMQRGICVYSVKGDWQLDHTIQSKIIAMAFSMAAEIERDLISQRTKEALRARKAAGASLGRPKGPGKSKLDPFRPEIEALLANGATKAFISTRYQTTPANLTNWMKKNGITRVDPEHCRDR
ncbi:MAG: recombinase family protein [Balneolales bacterium]|nr:recombinase family protein [Balneolales bacterium]